MMIGLGGAFGAGAATAPQPPIYEFGQIVVTGERPRVVDEVAAVDVVTAAQIERAGARTVDEAIALLPGLHVRRGAEGIPLIDVRGLRIRNVLVLLDGVPLNSAFDGLFDPAALSVESIARIKLTRGGSSVLYGPGGNGGVLDIVTRAAGGSRSSLRLERTLPDASALRGWASLRRGDLGLVVAGSLYDQKLFELSGDFEPTGLEDGGGRLNSDRRDRSLFASLTLGTRFGVNVNYRGGERGKPPVTEDFRLSPFAPRARFERVDHDALSVHAALSHDLGRGVTLRPALYFNSSDELTSGFDDDTFSSQRAPGALREEATTESLGGALQIAVRRGSRGLTTLALDLREERWEASGFMVGGGGRGAPPAPVVFQDDRSVRISSLAVEHELTPRGPLAAVFGAGWAAQRRRGGATDEALTFLIGATYALTEQSSLRGSVGRKVRFPTLRDLFSAGRGNPELDAERTLDYEIAVEHRSASEHLHLGLTLFRIEADDFIEGLPGEILRNVSKTRRQGVELEGRHRLATGARLTWSYTHLDAKNRSPGADVDTIQNQPAHKLVLIAEHELAGGTRLRADALHVADSYALSRTRPTRVRQLGDYTVLGIGVSRPILADRLRFIGRVTNLLDEDYAESIGFPAPGRSLLVGIELGSGR